MNEYKRVAVTGIGAVTPLGNNTTETWENLKAGKNGIGPITHFDTEKFKTKLGAEVRNFDPKEYLEVNEILRTDRSVQFAVTACASGSNAIGEAMRMIRHGYADAVITGGTESAICPSAVAGFVNMLALSVSENPDEASLPFDRRRNGFVIGEGSVALILEEYEHAVNRGAKIYGEVCGYGSSCDTYHITAPHPEAHGGAQAMMEAMKEAGYTPQDTVYINAHGTGTPMNDLGETLAIKKALGEEAARQAFISSTKSMTGHMLGAAGAIEALACLFALQEGVLPPTINLKEPDEACDLNYIPNTAVTADITLALSNSLGFGGHNACLAFRKV